MSHNSLACVVVRCDGCGTPALSASGEVMHWPDLAAAVGELSGPPWGWIATAEEQTCAACQARRECGRLGHEWGAWVELGALDPEELVIRVCDRCGRDEVTDSCCLSPHRNRVAGVPRPLRVTP